MLLEKEREDIVYYCQKLIKNGLTKGTGGNISIFNRDKGLIAISPSGMDYFEMKMKDIVILNIDGVVVEGDRKPSSEVEMHRIFYAKRNDIQAVVHAHSTYCTVLGTNREGLPASSYLIAFAGKDVRCAQYATFGTKDLAEKTFEGMRDRNAVIMANHGLLAGGYNIERAFNIAEEIEFCAKVYVKAKSIGSPVLLDDNEMKIMLEKFKTYGQK
ncbi:L-fuculose-phosphate aldolase [Pectinatus frisingensis]|uniref:L-fuculose-phosphate aldolase n=1 Tax=Pectinatus frisingensis TaxID=865 RepID=UPI0015F409D2|nr:L-fuculose-phosphate aldolase [Pectinatus frisingensis]